MKKKILLLCSNVLFAANAFGQSATNSNVKSGLKDFLDSYATPIMIVLVIVVIAWGFISNLGKIADKEGNGTRKEGLLNMLWITLGTIAAIIFLNVLISWVSSNMNLGQSI